MVEYSDESFELDPSSPRSEESIDIPSKLLQGEKLLVPPATWSVFARNSVNLQCDVFITNYAVHFIPHHPEQLTENFISEKYLFIPLQMIQELNLIPDENIVISISTKDGRILCPMFPNIDTWIYDTLYSAVFLEDRLRLFAFDHCNNTSDPSSVYDVTSEFARFGVTNSSEPWVLISQQGIWSTYPEMVAVHSAFSVDSLWGLANFRAKSRFPTLVFASSTGGTLWRSSQPQTGVTFARNTADENLLTRIRESSAAARMYIFDARSYTTAQGNRIRGGGVENSDYYEASKVVFLDMVNIHAVRKSLYAVRALKSDKFLSGLESSQWMHHMKRTLDGANHIVKKI